MKIDEREGAGFFLNDPRKLNDPFPDMKYFRENRPVFFYEPLDQWFVFGYEDAAGLFSDPRLSSDRIKGFVDVAPEEVREDLRKVAPYLEASVLMMDDPDHARLRKFLHLKLHAEPELLRGSIEETLRYEPPVTLIPRIALEDFELRGNTIRKGQIVQLSIASANRDATHFTDPHRFDITRHPSGSLSFGHSPHGCLGAPLVMEQTRIVLETLSRRMPGLRLDESREIEWYRTAGNHGPSSLPLILS